MPYELLKNAKYISIAKYAPFSTKDKYSKNSSIRIALCSFITNLHYAFLDDKALYTVTDYLGGGSLSYHLAKMKRLSEI